MLTDNEDNQFATLLPMPTPLPETKYINAHREMNIDDFKDASVGGSRLIERVESAQQEIAGFLDSRKLRLAEPLNVRITISVEATAEPNPDRVLLGEMCDPRCLSPTNPHEGRCWGFQPID